MPLPDKDHTINRLPMREEVYSQLLTWIMEGVFRPGEKLVDKELAENLGVSRTPVREAFRRLEDKGLVESSASRWTRVSEISGEEPAMIYPIIWTLEELALSSAADKLTENDFRQMETADNQLEKALRAGDPVAASKADAAFHDVFIQRSENDHLIKILMDLKIMYRRLEILFFEGYTHITTSLEEHRGIQAALEAGKLDEAQKILRTNWVNSLERLKSKTAKIP